MPLNRERAIFFESGDRRISTFLPDSSLYPFVICTKRCYSHLNTTIWNVSKAVDIPETANSGTKGNKESPENTIWLSAGVADRNS